MAVSELLYIHCDLNFNQAFGSLWCVAGNLGRGNESCWHTRHVELAKEVIQLRCTLVEMISSNDCMCTTKNRALAGKDGQ